MEKKIPVIIVISILLLLNIQSVTACTGFTSTKNGVTFVGNNNDWFDPDIYIRIKPAGNGTYGTFIVERKYPVPWDPDNINKCGGMNDQGLFYEKFNIYPYKLPVKSFYKRFYRPVLELEKYCLEQCSTVDEVIQEFSKYNLMFMFPYQSFFVDKNGDSIIIEGDKIIHKEGDYQLVTNFLQSQTKPEDIDCWRYQIADEMLKNMTDLSVDYFTSILNATHFDLVEFCTKDSQVYNLTSGEIYF